MARYKKKTYTKKATSSSGAGTASNIANMAMTAYKGYKFLKQVLNPEIKKWDQLTIATNISNAGVTGVLNAMGQGSDYNNRTGNSIKLHALKFRANISLNIATPTATNIRCIIVRDMENRQALPAIGDVLETADVRSPYNHNNIERFKIQYDQLLNFDLYHPTRTLEFSKSYKNAHCKYVGTTATVASVDEGSLFLLLLSELASNQPIMIWSSRVEYYDN